MTVDPGTRTPSSRTADVRGRVDRILAAFLEEMRAETLGTAPRALLPLEEVRRLLAAGGKRLRPAFCYWGFRAAGGADGDPIDRAAASLELLHTMALIHDDLMDRANERRGAPSSAAHLAEEARRRGSHDPDHVGLSLAILAGDLAAVLADRLFLSCGFPPSLMMAALDRYHRMRMDMAAGQCLDLLEPQDADNALVASLKGGRYTVAGPLEIGASLAGAGPGALASLAAFGEPLGIAFQLRDDERDADRPVEPGRAAALAAQALAALDGAPLEPEAVQELRALAERVIAG